jgi:hypothetical protein
MSRLDSGARLEIFSLFVVNISQPVGELDVARIVGEGHQFASVGELRLLDDVRRALATLLARGYVQRDSDGRFLATYLGISFLAQKKMGFPRDKHRIYFLKEVLYGRG